MIHNDIIDFLFHLELGIKDPSIDVLNPYEQTETQKVCESFYKKYYRNGQRVLLLGINPGRFGAGVTGIGFTDPIRLEEKCNIPNDLQKKPELSSQFIFEEVIDRYGGPEKFFGDFYISAVSPLGFTRHGVNYNYYDDKELTDESYDFIRSCLTHQANWPWLQSKVAVCIGTGKNHSFLRKLNDEVNLFEEIIALEHPRYILQYKRKQKQEYAEKYMDILKQLV